MKQRSRSHQPENLILKRDRASSPPDRALITQRIDLSSDRASSPPDRALITQRIDLSSDRASLYSIAFSSVRKLNQTAIVPPPHPIESSIRCAERNRALIRTELS